MLFTPLVLAALAMASVPARAHAASPTPIANANANSNAIATSEAVVSGTVKDTAGAPLSNVQVVVGGANRSALTDDRGRTVLVPGGKIAYVEIGPASTRKVGFGSTM